MAVYMVQHKFSLDKIPAKERQWNIRVSGDNSWPYLLFLLISVPAKQSKEKLGENMLIMIIVGSLLLILTIIKAFTLASLTKIDKLFGQHLGSCTNQEHNSMIKNITSLDYIMSS